MQQAIEEAEVKVDQDEDNQKSKESIPDKDTNDSDRIKAI